MSTFVITRCALIGELYIMLNKVDFVLRFFWFMLQPYDVKNFVIGVEFPEAYPFDVS